MADAGGKYEAQARSKYARLKSKIKIFFDFSQIFTRFPDQFSGVDYPNIFEGFLQQIGSLVSLDIWQLFYAECASSSRENKYFMKLLVTTLTPIGLIFLGAVIYTLQSRRKETSDIAQLRISSLCTAGFFLFTYIIFVPCSTAILEVFNCDGRFDGNEAFMYADYTTRCYTTQHDAMSMYAAVFLFVYPIGIPAMYFSVLFRHRNEIDPLVRSTGMKARMNVSEEDVKEAVKQRHEQNALKPLEFLFESYEPQYWWWETFNLFNRLIMTNANIYLSQEPLLRPFVVLVIALVRLKLTTLCAPFLLDSDDVFAEIGGWSIVAFLILTLMLQIHAVSSNAIMGAAMVTILLAIYATLVYHGLETQMNCLKRSAKISIDDKGAGNFDASSAYQETGIDYEMKDGENLDARSI